MGIECVNKSRGLSLLIRCAGFHLDTLKRMMLRSLTLASLVLAGMTACGRSQPDVEPATEQVAVEGQPVLYDSPQAAVEVGVVAQDGIPADSEWVRLGGDESAPLSYGYLCDEKPVGFWTYHHPNGSIAMQGTYLYGGVKDGEWRLWHANGKRLAQGHFDRGERIGEWVRWHDNGRRSTLGAYLNGERSGPWAAWHRIGKRKSLGKYVAGQPSGRWVYWNAKGVSQPNHTFSHPRDEFPADMTPVDRRWDGMTELEDPGVIPFRPGGE